MAENELGIKQNVEKILSELPAGVELVAAAKTKTPEEIREAIDAGVKIVGENYVQEAIEARNVGRNVRWHFIGHLQTNKVKKAVGIFDMIETVDSAELAREIDRNCGKIGKIMPVLIEVNSGGEPQKYGVLFKDVLDLVKEISGLKSIKIEGLMTMGPVTGNAEDARAYFARTKKLFDEIKSTGIMGIEMKYLSMGMTASYHVAIEEGANLVRIGTGIFGERNQLAL